MAEDIATTPHKQSIFSTVWFWLLIVSILLIIAAIIVKLTQKVTNALFWILISLGVLGFFISMILMVEWLIKPSKQKKLEVVSERTLQESIARRSMPPATVITP